MAAVNGSTGNVLPPFPDDVSVVPLLRISLKKIQEGDPAESQRYFEACRSLGFFYLDFGGSEAGEEILKGVDGMYDIAQHVFAQDLTGYDATTTKTYFGYKKQGVTVVDDKGNRDKAEFFNVSQDMALGLTPTKPQPEPIASRMAELSSIMRRFHSIVLLLLSQLDAHLHLRPGTLGSFHPVDSPSNNQVRFIRNPPQSAPEDTNANMGAHTDFGSITILFNWLGGLQVLPPGETEWLYVRPQRGCAVINLGDALTKFSNGLLRSNIHRVLQPPAEQAKHTRYSFAYFSWPSNDTLLKRLDSDVVPPLAEGVVEDEVTAGQWLFKRIQDVRAGTLAKEKDRLEREGKSAKVEVKALSGDVGA